MKLKKICYDFSLCKIKDYSQVNLNSEFCFISKTTEENSLVCPTINLPSNVTHHDDGWNGFYFEGILDFSLIGILSDVSSLLAKNKISIFAISTYNTDYIFIKKVHFQKTLDILKEAGYTITE